MNKKIVHSVFEHTVTQFPDQIAIEYGDTQITYHALNQQANQLAHALKAQDIGRESIVGLFLPASPNYIISLLGIAKSGGIFLPLDVETPEKRLEYLLSKATPKMIITEDGLEATLQAKLARLSENITCLSLTAVSDYQDTNPALISEPNDSSYLLFTSGSTGNPKAIVGCHKSLSHFIHWEMKEFGFDESVRVSLLAAPTFDVSLRDILVPLLAGGTLCIPSSGIRTHATRLLEWIQASRLTAMHCVPSLFRLISKELENLAQPQQALPDLQTILLAGEPVYGRDVTQWFRMMGEKIALVNLYGPSETTLAKAFHRIPNIPREPQAIVPIGQPIANTALLIIKNDQLCGIGEIGEIYVKTPFLSKGYYQDDSLMAASFVQNPFNQQPDMIYKTGDLGRYLSDRSVEFVGRIDNQVKVNGIRIELGELEQTVLRHPMIDHAIVIAHQTHNETNALACYYTSKKSELPKISVEELRDYMRTYLPEYMLPAFFIELNEFKLNAHGKIDRKVLPKPEELLYERIAYQAPSNTAEEKLATIWGDILGLNKVGVNNPFIDLGGDSLKAIRAVAKIYQAFEVEINLKDFFEYATIAQLTHKIAQTQKTAFTAIPVIPQQASYEVSHAQKRLWTLQQMDIDARAYNLPSAFWFEGECNITAFDSAFQQLVDRHESLRTSFVTVDGEIRQKIVAKLAFKLNFIDISNENDQPALAQKYVEQDKATPFDLTQAPLMRVTLLKLAQATSKPMPKDRYLFIFNIHHIISDVWSLDILMKEFLAFYRDAVLGVKNGLPPLRIQYKDYAAWQNELLRSEAAQTHQAYWHQQLMSPLPKLDLPTDFPRPSVQTFRGNTLHFCLDQPLTESLHKLSHRYEASLFMLLISLVNVLLYRYTGMEDMIIGSPIAGRQHPDLENQVGFYVNTLALRNHLQGEEHFSELLQRIRQNTTDAYDHQLYPFDRLVDELHLERDMSHAPLFDVMVMLQNVDIVDFTLADTFKISPFGEQRAWDISRFDLVFHFREQQGELLVDINYNTDLFKMERIQRAFGHFEQLSRSVCRDEQQSIQSLNLLTEAEKEQLLFGFNQRQLDYPTGKTIAQLFEAQVAKTPDHIALRFEENTLTYQDLNAKANQVAHFLRDNNNIQADDLIGVAIHRSEYLIIALLGVLKSGGAYLPIDPTYPQERIGYMLENSQCRVLLTDPLYFDTVTQYSVANVVDISKIHADPMGNPSQKNAVSDLAFVIYTSGSTGEPKGVMMAQNGFINMIFDKIKTLGISTADNVLQFASASFDASLDETFTALLAGATLVLVRRETIENTHQFVQYLENQGVTTMLLPPVYLSVLNQHPLKTVKNLLTAGEPAVLGDALFYAQTKNYYNAYGPTETSICASLYPVDPNQDYKNGIPIGKPTANTAIYILDDALTPVPIGIIGEICIAGGGVTRGYLNNAALTQTHFMNNPFKAGERLYKTGDLGRWLADGHLEFVGRKDDQVKIAGHRIEPNEIAQALCQHADIQDAIALANINDASEKTLVAYFTRPQKVELWPSIAEFFVYDDVVYRSMAHDEDRNQRYRTAFARVLKAKKVVEIGPGPEVILSRLCLEAGAEKVYAIEILEETYQKAQNTVRQLGLADRIILLHGDATQVELPEKVDYCISEIVGAIGGSEGAAKIINSARRFLHDPSCMIPQRSLTKIAAISLSESEFDYHFAPIAAHYAEQIFTQAGYPFDFRVCLKNWPQENLLSTSDVFEDLDYTQEIQLASEHDIHLTFEKEGTFNGFLVWLNLFTDETQVVDILELRESWLPVYLPINLSGVTISRGDTVQATIARKLCDNQLNPDYFIQGEIRRRNQAPLPFNYASYHNKQVFKGTAFYEKLFANDRIPVKPHWSVHDLRAFLGDYLPAYMLPAHFVALESFPLTPNGKIDKTALPAPETLENALANDYVAPQTEMEKRLAEVWQTVLHQQSVGIHDDYFSLGGDSIKAIQIAARVRQQGFKLEVHDIFQHATIAELALEVIPLERQIAQDTVTGIVPLTPIQAWFFNQPNPAPHHFNQAVMLKSSERLQPDALRTVLAALQTHHDALRMRYLVENNQVIQENAGLDYPLDLEIIDLTNQANPMPVMETHTNTLQASLNLTQGPLLKTVLFQWAQADYLLIVIHHLVVDTVSWRILLEDLTAVYEQVIATQPITLPPKTDAFKHFAEQLQEYANSETLQQELTYWQSVVTGVTKAWPRDHETDDNRVANSARISFTLDESETDILLTKAHQAYNTGIDDLLLTALAIALQQWYGENRTLIELEKHGREEILPDIDITRTVGWFTSAYPHLLELPMAADLGYQIKFVKESLHKIPNNGIGYGILRYLTPPEKRHGLDLSSTPPIGFNYLGQFSEDNPQRRFRIDWALTGQTVSPEAPRAHDLDIVGLVVAGQLEITGSYHNKRYNTASIEKLLTAYQNALSTVIAHCQSQQSTELTPADLTYKDISLEELDSFFVED